MSMMLFFSLLSVLCWMEFAVRQQVGSQGVFILCRFSRTICFGPFQQVNRMHTACGARFDTVAQAYAPNSKTLDADCAVCCNGDWDGASGDVVGKESSGDRAG